MSEIEGIVIVHIDGDGQTSYRVIGDKVRLFIVDECAPDDRVYEYLSRDPAEVFREIIPEGSEIGSSEDDRQDAIAHRVEAALEGRSHLSVVPNGGTP